MENNSKTERPPVVVVLGHVDHGKSTLLDYIRKTNVVESEAGGITQHTAAYEVTHEYEGESKRITFIDTPGHAAFGKMRERGAAVADIAILVVAADDGVKPQTLEVLDAIKKANVPFVVAITKIDKSGANIERAKQSLAEAEVYLEGYGGTVSFAAASGKTGEGIPTLLSLILLLASLTELTTDNSAAGEGVVVESHRDPKKGSLATLVIKNGVLKKGDVVLVDTDVSVARTLHNWEGKAIESAIASTPVILSGFTELPAVGAHLAVFADKRSAEDAAEIARSSRGSSAKATNLEESKEIIVPIVIKADSAGTLEALMAELSKHATEKVAIKLVSSGVGEISETDIKFILGSDKPVVLGFGVSADRHATDLALKNGIAIGLFDIIYKLTEWLDEYVQSVSPKEESVTVTALAKVLKTFSKTRDKQVIGGLVDR